MDGRTYSERDFQRVASSIGVPVSRIDPHRHYFESAATWYHLDSQAPSRVPPSTIKRRAKSIAAAARKLLQHLRVDKDYADDGPGDWELLQVLSYAAQDGENELICATGRINRLAEIFEAVEAAQLLQHCAEKAVEDAVLSGQLAPKGRLGALPENDWIAAMMALYERITRKKARTSVIAANRPDEGKAAGPLIRFLAAVGMPLGIEYSPDAWRARIRDIAADVGLQK